MRANNPVEVLARALHHAALVALPILDYEERDYEAIRTWSPDKRREAHNGGCSFPTRRCRRRPDPAECTVVAMFVETWSSTALGFGGIGGAAMTDAYTVVIRGPDGDSAVYWDGRLAYLVPRDAFDRLAVDLAQGRTCKRREAVTAYQATATSDDS